MAKYERRLRLLPSRVGLYFVLGMVLFPGTGYRGVWAKLTDALEAACPDLKALRDVRRRIGAAPLKALFEVLAGPLAWPRTPGVMFGRYRTVAFDGCRSIRVPDSEPNRGWLGKLKAALGETGYPAIQPGQGIQLSRRVIGQARLGRVRLTVSRLDASAAGRAVLRPGQPASERVTGAAGPGECPGITLERAESAGTRFYIRK